MGPSSIERCDFAQRSGRAMLPAWAGGPLGWQTLLDQHARGSDYRLVHAFSRSSLPFNLRVNFSMGEQSGCIADITVSRSTRVCLFARSIKIEAANLYNAENEVIVAVPDGFMPTHNQFEVRGDQTAALTDVSIPPFARSVRLDLASSAAYASSVMQLIDPQGVVRAQTFADAQPDDGLPIGGSHIVQVNATDRWRVTYLLHI